ncbi:MAG: 4-(cytidine 5'-diphospho)-2-C-methyl-D-erythritol kinase [Nanoarchaeota archaeon]|nr:4-(cytidine 5'-diphospho)-2-C-methyl-D-erythritol kinase [Nanoarchaeota archaeon]
MNSHAKINLVLDLLGKRPDGYHEVATVYQTVEMHDTIEVEASDELVLKCNLPFLVTPKNLCILAANLLRKKYNVKDGATITLEKKIPVAAGLAGGSSNAATVLRLLNRLWGLKLPQEELLKLASELGSDVPFHLIGGTCLGTGRGEQVKPLKPFPTQHCVIVHPGFGIKTKDAYKLVNAVGKDTTAAFIENYDLNLLHNDFEKFLFPPFKKLQELKSLLGPHALLSGSGSCVFGLFPTVSEAKEKAEELKKDYKDVWVTRTL